VNKEEFEEEVNELAMERRKPSFLSSSNLVTLVIGICVNFIIIAFSYGALMQKVDTNTDALMLLQQREITPGAERRVAVLEAQMMQLRQDSGERWREVRDSLARFESKLDAHMNGER